LDGAHDRTRRRLATSQSLHSRRIKRPARALRQCTLPRSKGNRGWRGGIPNHNGSLDYANRRGCSAAENHAFAARRNRRSEPGDRSALEFANINSRRFGANVPPARKYLA
jgi:hypothetical protein